MANKATIAEEQARRAVSLARAGNLGAAACVLVCGQVQNPLDGRVDEAQQRLHAAGDVPPALCATAQCAAPDVDEVLDGMV